MSSSVGPSLSYPPMRLPDTVWLHHRLTIGGPVETAAAFAVAARGAGAIPWLLDPAQIEGFYREFGMATILYTIGSGSGLVDDGDRVQGQPLRA